MRDGRHVPSATIHRLPLYLRVLEEMSRERATIASSSELAQRTGFSSEQIRKDLAYFGAFGTRGLGYDTAQLSQQLRRILGLTEPLPVALVGAGMLGTAIARYSHRNHHDTRVVAVFDVDTERIGKHILDVPVEPLAMLEARVKELGIRLGIITVPDHAAQDVLDRLAAAGVGAVLNFAPVKLKHHGHGVYVQDVDLTTELQSLAYFARREWQ